MIGRRSIAVALAAGLLAAACADESDDSSGGSDPAGTEASPDIAGETTTTTGPVTTEPPPATTAAPTTTEPPPTTAAPTTTAAPLLPAGYEGYVSDIYADDAVWICRPGMTGDVCARDLDATIVYADGTTEVAPFDPAADPTVDCFYVYPTVSNDPGANSDLVPAEDEEIFTALNQAARLGASCRVFAPVYRQVTLTALLGQVETDENSRPMAYADVVDAFRHFIANDSDGRPFVLAGHSQGAGIIRELIANEIDGEPALLERMVSALILGTSVAPDQFANVPMCATSTEVGCVVTYSSYRDTAPPPENGLFGRTAAGPAACVNPVDPAGGAAVSQPYFTVSGGLIGGGVMPFDEGVEAPEITTPFVAYPDMVTVECVDDGAFGYLQLTITSAPGPRVDDIGGDLTPEWGMHLVDANVAMGDLADLVAAQAAG